MWDPGVYQRFGTERARPFDDLLARVGADNPRSVVDLGCGPGELTANLADRWPAARVTGIDSSPQMIERARELASRVGFVVGDVRQFLPGPDVDVLVSNSVLQWVPGHARLLTRWAGALPAGAWLAVQMPGNFDAPSHRELRAVAAEPGFADVVGHLMRYAPVDDPTEYAALLTAAGCAVDAWETTYVHQLPENPDHPADHPVLRWMEGTALRPVRTTLDDDRWQTFRLHLQDRLARAYPVRDGLVYFPFRRIFVVARTATTG